MELTAGTLTPVQVQTPLPDGTKWQAVAAGAYHSIALDDQQRLWAWGYNNFGLLGVGSIYQSDLPLPVPFPSPTPLPVNPVPVLATRELMGRNESIDKAFEVVTEGEYLIRVSKTSEALSFGGSYFADHVLVNGGNPQYLTQCSSNYFFLSHLTPGTHHLQVSSAEGGGGDVDIEIKLHTLDDYLELSCERYSMEDDWWGSEGGGYGGYGWD